MSCQDNLCRKNGPGYKSPSEAMLGPREKIIYTVLVHASSKGSSTSPQPDCLATVDVDPESATFSKVIHLLQMKHTGDELHHFGWNACSSCCNDTSKSRDYLVLLGFKSSRIYIVNVKDDPLAPKIHKVIEPSELFEKANLSSPHTTHCLANGNIMISCLGDQNGNAPGGFLLLNSQFEIIGKWGQDEKINFNYGK